MFFGGRGSIAFQPDGTPPAKHERTLAEKKKEPSHSKILQCKEETRPAKRREKPRQKGGTPRQKDENKSSGGTPRQKHRITPGISRSRKKSNMSPRKAQNKRIITFCVCALSSHFFARAEVEGPRLDCGWRKHAYHPTHCKTIDDRETDPDYLMDSP